MSRSGATSVTVDGRRCLPAPGRSHTVGGMPVPAAHGVHKRRLMRDHIYETLRDAIVDGTLTPGERLRDTELEAWLGASRTPIREALLRLERAGLVVTIPGRATMVAPHDETSTIDTQQVVAAMHELAARLGTPRIEAAGIARMRSANERFAAALDSGDLDAALSADDDFHAVLVEAGANTAVASVLEQLTPVVRRAARRRFADFTGRASIEQHTRIVDRVAAGDAEAAAALSRANWLSLSHGASGVDPSPEPSPATAGGAAHPAAAADLSDTAAHPGTHG